MARSLQDTERTALRAGHHALQRGARGDETLGDVQVVLIHIVVVFRIGGGRFHQFVKELRGGLRGVLQNRQRFVKVLAADEVQHDGNLAGRDAGVSKMCPCFHCNPLLSFFIDRWSCRPRGP